MLFTQLSLIDPILEALKQEGYETPTPIQAKAIPHILDRRDVLGCAQTGTGKTAAFSIPMLQLLHQDAQHGPRRIRGLVLTPTRELAIQIAESLNAYGAKLPLKHAVVFGGVPLPPQIKALKAGIDILVATPGRLLDLMNQGFVHLEHIRFFVLDEADRMLDMGFIHDVKKVIKALPHKRQSLFFSATMPPEIVTLANTILTDPVQVEVTPVSSTSEQVEQWVFGVEKSDKNSLLIHLLRQPEVTRVLVFTRTKHGADKVCRILVKAGIKAQAIHGNKSQNSRQAALQSFKSGQTQVLVATDIAARGIDVEAMTHVINYELPNIPETYVHRIGRTGRAGAFGIAWSFCMDEEIPYLWDIEKLIKKSIPVAEDHPFRMEIPEGRRGGKKIQVKPASSEQNQQNRRKNKRPFNKPKANTNRSHSSQSVH